MPASAVLSEHKWLKTPTNKRLSKVNSMKKKRILLLSLGLIAVAPFFPLHAFAQAPDALPATAKQGERPLTYALISAVGDRFTFVRKKQSTGTNIIDTFTRKVVKIPDNALNSAVLRGLDRALAQSEPASTRVFLSLDAAELDNVLPQDREAVALGKVVSAVEKMPQRKDWDKIVIVAPKYMQSEYSGMGSKLAGLGVYIQPLRGAPLSSITPDSTNADLDAGGLGDSDTTSPDGSKSNSKRYVAPFSYLQVWVLDAKTLNVLEKNARHDFTKLFDKESAALDVANSIPDDLVAARILRLAERSAAGAMGADLSAVVEIGDVTAIDPKTGDPLKKVPTKK
jgi:hypothetical protein